MLFEHAQLLFYGEALTVQRILQSVSRHSSVTPAVLRMRLFEGVPVERAVSDPFIPGDPPKKPRPTPYRGVYWRSQRACWEAQIYKSNKQIKLGVFSDDKLAAHAYDIAALRYHGPDAKLNFRG